MYKYKYSINKSLGTMPYQLKQINGRWKKNTALPKGHPALLQPISNSQGMFLFRFEAI